MIRIKRLFEMNGGTYGLATVAADREYWVMEQDWEANAPHISCVPEGRYALVSHNGKDYKGTYALVGDTVSQWQGDRARFACVIHKSVFPTGLAGCLAFGRSISPLGMLVASEEATAEVIEWIDKHPKDRTLLIIDPKPRIVLRG